MAGDLGQSGVCPNPYCDGTGWIRCDATGTANAYRAPACRVGPHLTTPPEPLVGADDEHTPRGRSGVSGG